MDDYQLRRLAEIITYFLAQKPVVLLHGARQTGKTTLSQHLARTGDDPARYYLALDDAVLASARNDPAAFLAGLHGPVVLDEVQRAPDLLPAILAEVAHHPNPGRFLLIASTNVLPIPQPSESLAEQIEILTLWPFSQGEGEIVERGPEDFLEALFCHDILSPAGHCDDLPARILRGGYQSALDPESRRAWFDSYVTTVLGDIRSLSHIDALSSLPQLLAIIAARTAGLLNFMDLARGSGIPQTTLKRYFALLEAAFLARLVPAWTNKTDLRRSQGVVEKKTKSAQRLIQAPKLYVNDTGLAAYLLDLDEKRLERDAGLKAALLENFVAMELEKQAGWIQSKLFHFRTAAGQKVDFVLENQKGEIVGVEVKASDTISDRDFNGLRALAALAGRRFRNGIVLHTGSTRDSLEFEPEPQFQLAPVSALWQNHMGRA